MIRQTCHRFSPSLAVLTVSLLRVATANAQNTAYGTGALTAVTTGSGNVAFGNYALPKLTIGGTNVAIGDSTLYWSMNGFRNTALGYQALGSLRGGQSNIAIGALSGAAYYNDENANIVIANRGVAFENGAIRIGDARFQTSAYIAGISGSTASSGAAVYVDTSGKLGTLPSSLRFKEDVKSMGDNSKALMQLHPVTFYYKQQYDDGSHLAQYGLIAEEVAKVYPGLVQYDTDGQAVSVRYQFVNAMLLNEVQRQHHQITAQQVQIDRLENQVKTLLEQRVTTRN